MSSAWGRSIIKIRWLVPAAAVLLLVVVASVTWGFAVYGELASGGFDDPTSESVRTPARIAQKVGVREPGLVVLGSLTVLPAALTLVGHRINAWRVPLPWRRREPAATATAAPGDVRNGFWARLTHSVTRRPVRYLTVVGLVLAALVAPALGSRFSGADEHVTPPSTEARIASDRIAAEFPGSDGPIEALLTGTGSDWMAVLLNLVVLRGPAPRPVGDRPRRPNATGCPRRGHRPPFAPAFTPA